jgi:hypothetical protein
MARLIVAETNRPPRKGAAGETRSQRALHRALLSSRFSRSIMVRELHFCQMHFVRKIAMQMVSKAKGGFVKSRVDRKSQSAGRIFSEGAEACEIQKHGWRRHS